VKTTITERGQISIPARLRREMHLAPGQTLIWQQISPTECRVTVPPKTKVKPDPIGALGFAKEHGLETMPTEVWMKMLRAGEED
jgi:bifunctional DNA-binding transcriptional regulator/antitoxin component of YhaV-PrlF toxin-antitoxin module